jgi:hypothetical protein
MVPLALPALGIGGGRKGPPGHSMGQGHEMTKEPHHIPQHLVYARFCALGG